MLIGTWECTADATGRLVLPPAFSAVARAGLTVTRGFDRCLHAFPRAAWDTLARRLGALPLGAESARHLRRFVFGAAADLIVDDGGSVGLPAPLLAYAEIRSTVVLVGMDSYFEIWSPEAWATSSEQLLAVLSRWRGSDPPAPLAAI